MKLQELRNMYQDEEFIIGHKGDTLIVPKKVKIKSDLTVWYDGGCIINGMKDKEFDHHKNSVSELSSMMGLSKEDLKLKKKKVL